VKIPFRLQQNIALVFLAMIAVVQFSGIASFWPNADLNRTQVSGASYEALPGKAGTGPILISPDIGTVQKATIRFSGLAVDDVYDNFFQTSDSFALRLELNSNRRLFLGAADQIFLVDDNFELGTWHRFELIFEKGVELSVKIDDRPVFSSNEKPVLERQYDFGNIVIGTGFARLRPLQGAIKDFSITADHHPDRIPFVVLHTLELIILAGTICLAFWPSRSPAALPISIPIVCLAVPLAVYQWLYMNSFYPITEGWFSEYANLIRDGMIPYRDFPLLLPPLYPLTIAAFQSVFGEGLFALHALGMFITVGIGLALFCLLRGIFNDTASAFAALIGTIYYQSGVAFLGYDFTQFLTLYLLTAGILVANYAARIVQKAPDFRINRLLCFVAGVFLSFAILTKHSNGSVATAFLVLAVIGLATQFGPWRERFIEIVAMATGGLLPILAVFVWLALNDAIPDFIQNVLWDALAAKGGSDAIFSHGLSGIWGGGPLLLNAMAPAAMLASTAAIIIVATLLVQCTSNMARHRAPFAGVFEIQSASTIRFLLFSGFGMSIMILAVRSGLAIPDSAVDFGMNAKSYAMLISIALYVIGVGITLALVLCKPSRNAAYLFVIFVFGLGLVFGNGTSAGISEISAFVGVALVIAALMALALPTILPALIPATMCAAFAATLVSTKFEQPYFWWSVQPQLSSVCAQTDGFLAHVCVYPSDYLVISRISNFIKTNSSEGQKIYVFPHMPVFNIISKRGPFKGAVVSWPDFMSDRIALSIADSLKSAPPPIIIVGDIPEYAMASHERLFRAGGVSGQRSILKTIDDLVRDGRIIEALPATTISRVNVRTFRLNSQCSGTPNGPSTR
jgi:hypothetical protein